jgi:LacI family transcriptional regulator
MIQKSRQVLLALMDTHHGYLKGVIRYAREHHWQLATEMIYNARIPHGWKGDGIVSFTGFRDDLADFIRKAEVPVVEISFMREDLAVPQVGGDDDQIGRMAAEHFLDRGYQHYAWAPFIRTSAGDQRHASFVKRLRAAGFDCQDLPPLSYAEADSEQTNWLARRHRLIAALIAMPKPLAIFAFNDCAACEVLNACEEAGIPVPESVAVLGVDNDLLFCEMPGIQLSSIRHDLEGIAYEACALLDRLMSGEPAPAEPLRRPPLGLVTRRSTDILAVNNLQVAKALRLIREEFANPVLDVTRIVAATGISRRSLEIAFRRELNRSPGEEILRLRLDKVRRLLEEGDLTIAEVARASGFSHPNHLHRIFKKHFGLTPRVFQKAWPSANSTSLAPGTL